MRQFRLIGATVLAALALALLASCQPKTPENASAVSPADSMKAMRDSLQASAAAARGGRVFLTHCAMCHGNGGNGDGDAAAALKAQGATVARLNDAELMDQLSRDSIVTIIRKGGAHTGRSSFMPAWADSMNAATIDDVAQFVITLRTANPAIPRSTLASYLMAPPGVPAEGRELFVHHCVACHGDQGKGDGDYGKRLIADHNVHPRDLTDATYMAAKTDRDLYAVIDLGGGHFRKAVYMPAWTQTLTPAQIKSLIAYVRAISHTAPKP